MDDDYRHGSPALRLPMALTEDSDIILQALIFEMDFEDALLSARERIPARQKIARQGLGVSAAQVLARNEDVLVGAVGHL